MYDKIIALIHKEIDEDLKPKRNKSYALKEKVKDEALKKKLDFAYNELNAKIERLVICIEILNGHSFTFWDEICGINVLLPKDGTRVLLEEAEGLGAKISGYFPERNNEKT